jgi:uncharacterized protein YdeI (YjbR/CyaY-like superfamily)
MPRSVAKAVQPLMAFRSAAAFRRWLRTNHAVHPGIWMKLAKKGSGIPSLTYAEALDVALCHGWIDGQKRRHDDRWWLQKFTKRGPRSLWSKINLGHVARLEAAGLMQPAGRTAVAAAQADGRWARAYDSSRTAELPADFLAAIASSKRALACLAALTRGQRYAIFFRLTTAKKPETRARLLSDLVARLKSGEKFSLF